MIFAPPFASCLFADVVAEKQQQAHLKAVEEFNTGALRHANTQEKSVLPDKKGLIMPRLFLKSCFQFTFCLHLNSFITY